MHINKAHEYQPVARMLCVPQDESGRWAVCAKDNGDDLDEQVIITQTGDYARPVGLGMPLVRGQFDRPWLVGSR